MLNIKLNERPFETAEGTTLFGLRDRVKPDADVVILNGAAMNTDAPLKDVDEVSLIKRGEMPSADELEALMASRHTPGVHAKVKAATVGIAGLGGLGSAIAVALARVGVGKLIVADFDVVEPSNLNRQQYFVDQIGMLKTDALVSNLRKINPYVQVEAHAVKLTPGNIFPLFENVDIMIEAFDRADQKAMLLQSFTAQNPDVPFIGASGMAGFGPEETLGVKKMGRNIYIVGDLSTAAQPGCGLMAPRVGIVASMQANLALRLIVESE
jgi:sulfur carrier protein ThiS adenylyltransferase